MAETPVDSKTISKLQNLILLKDEEYKQAIKNNRTFEVTKKILEEKRELEKELRKKMSA